MSETRSSEADRSARRVWTPLAADGPAGSSSLGEGGRPPGPIQGFGKMWQKTYRVRLEGATVSPAEVLRIWKERFSELWPEGSRLYAPLTGIEPGEAALIAASGPSLELSTGAVVLYADDESFTLMTPPAHVFAGWITFGVFAGAGATVAQAQVLMRARDPLTELRLAFGGRKRERRFWERTLGNLASALGVDGRVETHVACVDRRRRWSLVGDLRRLGLAVVRPRGKPPAAR